MLQLASREVQALRYGMRVLYEALYSQHYAVYELRRRVIFQLDPFPQVSYALSNTARRCSCLVCACHMISGKLSQLYVFKYISAI